MKIFIYDGSFQGFLTVIYDALFFNEDPDEIIVEGKNENELFAENKYISTDTNKADKIIKSLTNKFNLEITKNIYYAFLSDIKNIEKYIFRYIKLSLEYGKDAQGFYSNEAVDFVYQAVKKVLSEKYKFYGILRFKLLNDGLFYASIEPDNNIISLLINHFKKRYSNQKWIIHDLRRNTGVFYDCKNARMISISDYEKKLLTDDDETGASVYDEKEIEFQKLWKTYFKRISISERKNIRLQRKYIPIRYWKYLIEKN
jgi:probable DNA metabolism protein